ncbi:MAG: hypothetical protein CK425_05505 [Parachlamydia sp.]|nr:MAG: hypothetical protein CK425_05505 [Parachlamydia sp.]
MNMLKKVFLFLIVFSCIATPLVVAENRENGDHGGREGNKLMMKSKGIKIILLFVFCSICPLAILLER